MQRTCVIWWWTGSSFGWSSISAAAVRRNEDAGIGMEGFVRGPQGQAKHGFLPQGPLLREVSHHG